MGALRAWARLARPKFMLASVVAVCTGLALQWWQSGTLEAGHAALTMAGVLALHASVDMLNDYHDYRRGIDSRTRRTGMSGGTGVLPEGLLEPEKVRRAGLALLAAGASAGAYFVYLQGWPVAALLAFAVVSVYMYSGRIVDTGLAEVFVAAKGAAVVAGTYLIQSGGLGAEAAFAGAAAGCLSALVLFVTSFPDHDADKAGGRRTLVTLLGRRRAAPLFWVFAAAAYASVAAGALSGALPPSALLALAALPLAARAGLSLRRGHSGDCIEAMSRTVWSSRAAGALAAAGIALG